MSDLDRQEREDDAWYDDDFEAGYKAALVDRGEPRSDDVEIVAQHLAEREHGGPFSPDGPICEGYKDEARMLLSRLNTAREDTTPCPTCGGRLEAGEGSRRSKGGVRAVSLDSGKIPPIRLTNEQAEKLRRIEVEARQGPVKGCEHDNTLMQGECDCEPVAVPKPPPAREDVSFYVKAGTVCLFGPNLAAKPLPKGMLVVPETELLAAREDTERPDELSKMDEVELQRLAAHSLPEGPCRVCGNLGMSKVGGDFLCLPHFIELEKFISDRERDTEQESNGV